ncbi:uncharacterized protein LOC108743462 [Agrilus planipennis]|uniref:Uncharacterized protein LOC108743462 n=1 Tax=Agrilus planipennis TaxID=224129 RepID=A0A1W4XQ55_AGRPL|nr:uncharacterized protein LOC108743462 [Agrilus planipennis]
MGKISSIFVIVFLTIIAVKYALAVDDYNVLYRDSSFEFGYDTPDSYHHGRGNRNNVVHGEFGGRSPSTGHLDSTQYTAGPRGYRPRGKNVVRKYDLSQNGPRSSGSKDDPYFDDSEDPSYNFGFKTRTYQRQEVSNNVGDVTGKFSYIDDVGDHHNVDFVAGKNTGFHVKTPFPDSNPKAYGPLFFKGRGKPIPRGRTSIQRQLDGSYRFVSAGPDQRRTETSDSSGHVRGSYTYLDDKGVQHTVHYIAGPETGYRVLKTVKGPHLPNIFPFGSPEYVPPNLYNDYSEEVFTASESGRVKPKGNFEGISSTKDESGFSNRFDNNSGQNTFNSDSTSGNDDFGDIFGKDDKSKNKHLSRPFTSSSQSYKNNNDGDYEEEEEDNGSYNKPSGDEGPNKEDDDQENCCNTGNSGINVQISGTREGAIVTNSGKKVLSVPPGVSVRAHVQAIDLIPLKPKVRSPGDELKEEVDGKSDQFGAE